MDTNKTEKRSIMRYASSFFEYDIADYSTSPAPINLGSFSRIVLL